MSGNSFSSVAGHFHLIHFVFLVIDFRRRFLSLLSYQFHRFYPSLALSILKCKGVKEEKIGMFFSSLLFALYSIWVSTVREKQNFFKFMEKSGVLYQVRELVNSHTLKAICLPHKNATAFIDNSTTPQRVQTH